MQGRSLKKINLQMSPPPSPSKRRILKEASAIKRLKYCFRRKNTANGKGNLVDTQENSRVNYCYFNDSSYFDANNSSLGHCEERQQRPSTERKKISSNLLERGQEMHSRQETLVPSNPQTPQSLFNSPSKKVISGDIFHKTDFSSFTSSSGKFRPKSVREAKRPWSSLTENTKQSKAEKQAPNSSRINPYTNKEYMYFRRAEKAKAKQAINEIHKKQVFIQILKPCQIMPREPQQSPFKKNSIANGNPPAAVKFRQHPRKKSTKQRKEENMLVLEPWQFQNGSHFLLEEHF